MSRLDSSSAFDQLVDTPKDYTDKNNYPDGISGVYPNTAGSMTFTDELGNSRTAILFAGATPPIRGKINITALTGDVLIGLN